MSIAVTPNMTPRLESTGGTAWEKRIQRQPDESSLRVLVRRLAKGRVGTDVKNRERLLTELYAAGFPAHEVDPVVQGGSAHTLLLWANASRHQAELFVPPNEAISETLDRALDAACGLQFSNAYDCSMLQLGAALRVMSSAGVMPVEKIVSRVNETRREFAGDEGLHELPSVEELHELHGVLQPWHAGTVGRGKVGFMPQLLNRVIGRSVAILDLRPVLD